MAALNANRAEMRRMNRQLQKANVTNKMLSLIDSQMKTSRSMHNDLYPSTDRSGPLAGAAFSSNARMRKQSRIALWQSDPAKELVTRFSDLVVGSHLRPESMPAWRVVDSGNRITTEARSEWTKNTESRYLLWGKSQEVDYTKHKNLFQLEQQYITALLRDGEYFEVYRYVNNSRKNPLTIQYICPEDVRTPTGSRVTDGNIEHNGIEYNAKNQPVAYHIYNHNTCKTVRVPRMGSRSGRVFVNHVKLGDKLRGIPFLADSVSTITKLGDWSALELQAAIVNALFAVWISPPEEENGQSTIGGGVGKKSDPVQSTNVSNQFWQDIDTTNYQEGGIVVDQLPAGHSIESFDTKRPNLNFDKFYSAIKRDLAASKGMSLSVLDFNFDASYSSARGELLLVWNTITKMRKNMGWSGNDVRFKMWLWGEVAAGSIAAPGWNESDEMRDAWSNAEWVGSQRPDIDPLRSVKAALEDHNRGYKTGKMIAAERGGGDYDENLVVITEELDRVARANEPLESLKKFGLIGGPPTVPTEPTEPAE